MWLERAVKLFVFKKPTLERKDIFDIPFELFIKGGVKVVVFDIDNTITAQGEDNLSDKTVQLFKTLKTSGLTILLATNSLRDITNYKKTLKVDVIQPKKWQCARKPSKRFFKIILNKSEHNTDNILVIGDKYFFDINPALKIGMKAVLVKPLGEDIFIDRLLAIRFWQKIILNLTKNNK